MLTLLCAVVSMAWGETETVFYTLTPTTGTNNGYANNCDIAINGITWNVTGNATFTPWRIGGKSLDKVDRTVYSKTAMGSEIDKVELSVGNASSITVNSLKLVVASDAAFSNLLDEVSATFSANSTITFEPTSGGKWDNNSYYKFIFNVSVSGTSNKFVEFSEAKFYKPSGSQQLTGEKFELLNGTPTTIVEGDYIITCNSSSDKYAMSNDDSNNTFKGKTDFAMDGNANIVTDDKTIIWHIAPRGEYWTIQSLDDDGQYAAYIGSSNGVTMTSTVDDKALWSYNGNNGFTNKANNATLYCNNSGNFSFTEIGTPVLTLYRMPDKYYVAGSWTTWETGKIEMTKKADGTFTLENQELPAEAQFKIIKVVTSAEGAATIWCGGTADGENYWVTVDNHQDISLNVDGGKNFYMPIAGTWTFIVNPTDATLTVDGDWPEWEYYLLGDFNEWEKVDSYKFSQVGETSIFTLNKPIQFEQKFKIKGFRGNEEKWIGAVSNGDFWVNAEHVGTELSLTTENDGENFYMNLSNKKSYWELEFDAVNMKLVLGNYLSDIAELPFEFDGGKGDIENKEGLTTTTGLGDDYSNSPKLQFKASSQELVLHFDERPGTLSFDIKGNSFSGGTFQVLTSEDGEDYDVLKEYTSISGATTGQHEEFDNLDENVRYIKWLYKQKSSGNVALGNIVLEKYVAPQSYTLNIDAVENGEVFVFYNDPDNNYPAIEDGDEVLESSEVMVSVSAEEGYEVKDIAVTDADGQRLELTEKETGISWTFTMPKSDVTVSCTVEEINYDQEEWVLTPLADLTEDDIFVIVGNNGDTFAMSNASNPPQAITVSIVNNKIITPVADNIKWNISGDETNGYIFYPNGDDENWLYLKDKDTNNGVCVGTKEDGHNLFIIKSGYLFNEATERYVGIYNSSNWRCYTSTSTNIANQTFGFYKLIQPEKFEFSINENASDGTDCYATISALGEGNWKVKGDVTVSTVVVENKVLTYPIQFVEGDVIPGDGAYLVKGAAGDYAFEKTKNPKEVDLGNNMLLSTGEGNIQTNAPTGETDNNKYYFYKLSLNAKSKAGSVGFYWGAPEGAPFTYGKAKQAYLAVPKTDAFTVQGFSFDGTTGIAEVESAVTGNDEVYTISGMRVDGSNLSKGVYIVNGKKVIIK